ncbi:MAG: sugar phosphate nucleotidyltransferase [Egibacteraceae bacterium]
MHAVILAGGKGTRLRPLTDARPKPLVPFVGDPFAAGLLRRLVVAGCTGATFLVGRDAGPFAPLRTVGADLGIAVDVVAEPVPLDTAGAARDLLRGDGVPAGDPILVCNGDVLTDLDYAALIAAHQTAGAVATLALTRVDDPSSFGVIECDGTRVERFVEKPPPGTAVANTVNAGTYALDASAFDGFSSSGPLSFERDVFPDLLAAGTVLSAYTSDAYWQDLGTLQRYLAGHAAVLDGRCSWPLSDAYERRSGSVLVHPRARVHATATLVRDVVVGPDARVGPAALLDTTAVFAGATVGAGAKVVDSVVDTGAAVAAGAQIGPQAVVAA